MIMKSKGEVLIYKSPEGKAELEVKLKENTVWLTQKQMSNLFQKDVPFSFRRFYYPSTGWEIRCQSFPMFNMKRKCGRLLPEMGQ